MKKSLFFAFLTVFSGCLGQEEGVWVKVNLTGLVDEEERECLLDSLCAPTSINQLNYIGEKLFIQTVEDSQGVFTLKKTEQNSLPPEDQAMGHSANPVLSDSGSSVSTYDRELSIPTPNEVGSDQASVTTPCPQSNEPSLFTKGWKTFEKYMVSSGVRACAYDAIQSSSMGTRYPHFSQILSSTAVDVALESGRKQEFDPKDALRILSREAVFCIAQYGITSLKDKAPTLVAQWYGTLQEQKEKKMWLWMACDVLPRLAIDTAIALIEAHVMQEED